MPFMAARENNYVKGKKPPGEFAKLVDIVSSCRKYGIEPKEIRFVMPKISKKPNIMLMKCVKGGNPELKFLDSLVVYKEDGSYTEEIYEIYNSEKIDVFDKRG